MRKSKFTETQIVGILKDAVSLSDANTAVCWHPARRASVSSASAAPAQC